jgi:hypothetical protein
MVALMEWYMPLINFDISESLSSVNFASFPRFQEGVNSQFRGVNYSFSRWNASRRWGNVSEGGYALVLKVKIKKYFYVLLYILPSFL